jgi:hypothetical protein
LDDDDDEEEGKVENVTSVQNKSAEEEEEDRVLESVEEFMSNRPPSRNEFVEDDKPLENSWRIWYEKVNLTNDWTSTDHIKELCDFSTIQEFWSCFNNLPPLGVLKPKESFHLMKKNKKGGIRPIWEDEENKQGGEWIFRVRKEHADIVWSELVFAVIGEQYSDYIKKDGDDICGLTVSMRPVDVVFQLWHRLSSDPEKNELLERTKALIPKDVEMIHVPFYKKHST